MKNPTLRVGFLLRCIRKFLLFFLDFACDISLHLWKVLSPRSHTCVCFQANERLHICQRDWLSFNFAVVIEFLQEWRSKSFPHKDTGIKIFAILFGDFIQSDHPWKKGNCCNQWRKIIGDCFAFRLPIFHIFDIDIKWHNLLHLLRVLSHQATVH